MACFRIYLTSIDLLFGRVRVKKKQDGLRPQIFNKGRYSISNINQQLTICRQMLKTWWVNLFVFLQCCVKTWCISCLSNSEHWSQKMYWGIQSELPRPTGIIVIKFVRSNLKLRKEWHCTSTTIHQAQSCWSTTQYSYNVQSCTLE